MFGKNTHISDLFLAYENLYPTNHLFIFSPNNLFRKACVVLTTSKIFDWFIMLAIATNFVMMATNTPFTNDDESNINHQVVSYSSMELLFFTFNFC